MQNRSHACNSRGVEEGWVEDNVFAGERLGIERRAVLWSHTLHGNQPEQQKEWLAEMRGSHPIHAEAAIMWLCVYACECACVCVCVCARQLTHRWQREHERAQPIR